MKEPRQSLFQQLLQRRLFQVLLVYLGLAFGLVEVSQFVVENYDLSRRLLDVTLFLLILGIPAVAVIAWFHGEKGSQGFENSEMAILAVLVVIAAVGTYRIGTADPAPVRDLSAVVDLGAQSVAVMPFSSRLTDPEMEWLSAGVSELLTTGLAGLSSIRVVSGQRLFDLMRQEGRENATEIPADLATRLTRKAGARFMVDGSILGSRDDLVLTADLVNVETGDVEASSRVRGADVFALVDQIAAELSRQIAGQTIASTELASVSTVTTRDPEAYREYLLAVQAERRFHREEALEHYLRAVELDSTFALAHIRLSNAAFNAARISVGIEALQAAREYRSQAPERDRMFLDAMVARSMDSDSEAAREILTRLIGQYPDDKEARSALGQMYPANSEERAQLLEEAILLDPLDGNAINELAYFKAREGDFVAADSLIARYVALEPNEPNPLDSKGEILMMAGRHEEARTAFRQALSLRPDFGFSLEHLADSWAAEGRYDEGVRELARYADGADAVSAALAAKAALAGLLTLQGRIEQALQTLSDITESAREHDIEGRANTSMLTELPFLMTLQEWDRLNRRAGQLLVVDPLSPFPPLTRFLAAAEQGRLPEARAVAAEIRDSLAANPALGQFAPLLNAFIERELNYFEGDYEASVEGAERLREAGGMPELGTYVEPRALLELGRYGEALEAARRTGTFNGPAQRLVARQRTYYVARAHEGLADTTNAIAAYESFLSADWAEATRDMPLFADAPERLAALKRSE